MVTYSPYVLQAPTWIFRAPGGTTAPAAWSGVAKYQNVFYFWRICISPRRKAMGNPVIVEAVRAAQGKRRGWLAGLHPALLLGAAQVEVLKRSGIDPDL